MKLSPSTCMPDTVRPRSRSRSPSGPDSTSRSASRESGDVLERTLEREHVPVAQRGRWPDEDVGRRRLDLARHLARGDVELRDARLLAKPQGWAVARIEDARVVERRAKRRVRAHRLGSAEQLAGRRIVDLPWCSRVVVEHEVFADESRARTAPTAPTFTMPDGEWIWRMVAFHAR